MPGSIGATDIYVVDILDDNEFSEPRNLGPKINTAGREIFPFITNEKLYFASDGHLGLGGLDVFEVKNGDGFGIPTNLGAPLNSDLDDFGYITNEETKLGFVCSNRAGGKGADDIYSFSRNPITTKEADCNPLVNGYVSNTVTGERIANAMVSLFDESGKLLVETQTNLNGNYSFIADDLNCNTRYDVKVNKVGYGPAEKPFKTTTAEVVVPLGLKLMDERIVEDNRGLVKIKIGIIYFDLDKSFIRNDAAIEWNKVVLLMRQYPNMIINVESHTDSRSPDDYNLELSDRRAKEARDYIIAQGIRAERILSAIGYGEMQIINNCKNGVLCSEAQHQLNRRSEFIIIIIIIIIIKM